MYYLQSKFNNARTKLIIQINLFYKRLFPIKNVYNVDETIDYLLTTNSSISRLGDGEFHLIFGRERLGFQDNTPLLQKKLKEVLRNNVEGLIVAIPHNIIYMDDLVPNSYDYWRHFYGTLYHKLYPILQKKRKYADAGLSRLYMGYKDKSNPRIAERFERIKLLWQDKNLLIIEGKDSKLGTVNDYFNNSNSIRRIICPPKNAFEKIDAIKEAVRNHHSPGDVLILALGPTATVLAYDLAKENIRCLDLGHIDVEYEWFKLKATSKVPIKGKVINEVTSHQEEGDFANESYEKSIITIIN